MHNLSYFLISCYAMIYYAISTLHYTILCYAVCCAVLWTVCRTPLHFAASVGSVEMVKLLLSVGADASLTTINGDTAYDIAVQEDKKDVIALLPNLKNSDL